MSLGGASVRLHRAGLWLALLVLATPTYFAGAADSALSVAGSVPRVLVLYPYDERIAATIVAGEAMRNRLVEATDSRIDLFSEFLDLSRFPEPEHVARMGAFLAEKYSAHRPDVVVALGKESASFIATHRNVIAPGAKIITAGFRNSTAEDMELPKDVIGAFSTFDILKTAEMARALQPNAHHLYIIGGSSDFDRAWLASSREALRAFSAHYDTTYLEDLTIDEFVDRAARVPSDSIILALTVFKDRSGRNFIPREALRRIASSANAPIYGPYDTYVDYGVVGGNTVTFENLGQTVADLVLAAIAGRPLHDVDAPQSYFADFRQLRRWGLTEANLPAGTVVAYRDRGLWEEYWPIISGTLGILLVQASVIAILLIERRRRQAAERRARIHLLEAVHLNQSATASALSSSIAHELNQPLSAIRNNAEAASELLRTGDPDLSLIRQILADILADDRRAGDIIGRMKGLLKKRNEIDWQEFDLNDITFSAIRIIHAEAERRGIALKVTESTEPLSVRADRVHIQQVVLNLATNAMDAMSEVAAPGKTLIFVTGMTNNRATLSVADTGTGISEGSFPGIFEPFYTTKEEGTGLGLPIARSIIETYGGAICAFNRPEGGAIFRIDLPLARRQEGLR